MTDYNIGDTITHFELFYARPGTVVLDSKGLPRVVANSKENDDYAFTDRQGWEDTSVFKVVYVPEPEPEVDPITELAWTLKGVWFNADKTSVDPGSSWRRVAEHVRENYIEKNPKVDYPLTIVDLDGDTWSRVPDNIDLYYFLDADVEEVVHDTRDGIRYNHGIRREF